MATGNIVLAEVAGAPALEGHGTLTETPGEKKQFPPFDSTTFPSQLLWLAITFGLLYYLMAKIAVPRIAGILEDRRDRIAGDLDAAERLKSESQAALTGYEKALAGARSRASTIADTARNEAKAAADAKRAAIEADLNRKLTAAEVRIGDIKQQALSQVGAIAGEATEAIVKSLIGADAGKAEVDTAVAASMVK
ncbi:F0F1 ATP synthase subunit B [soil metagenome]